jgi:hypothetical protein
LNNEYFAYDHNIAKAQFGRNEQGQDLRMSSLIKIVNAFEIYLPPILPTGHAKPALVAG